MVLRLFLTQQYCGDWLLTQLCEQNSVCRPPGCDPWPGQFPKHLPGQNRTLREKNCTAHSLSPLGSTTTDCNSTVIFCFPLCLAITAHRLAGPHRATSPSGVQAWEARRGCQERRRLSQAEQPSVSHSSRKPANGPAPAHPPPPAPASLTRGLGHWTVRVGPAQSDHPPEESDRC